MRLRVCALTFLAALGTVGVFTHTARADFSFVHVTDVHVGATSAPNSNAAKDIALFKEISGLSPKPAFVMNTGDVCEIGTDAEYAVHKTVSAALTVPYYAAPGNHDVRWNPRGKEGYTKGTGQPLYRSWNKDNVHFVLLDSTVLLQHWGHFDQAQLDWLAQDLKKVGDKKPVVIGFHHMIYRPGSVQVDNQAAFLRTIAPYNVRLLLIGHGHSDIQWNVNGIPAVMSKGLYQGSYHLVRVGRDKLTVFRRTEQNPTKLQEVLTEPLARPVTPARDVKVAVTEGHGTVRVLRRTFPEGSTASFRVDEGTEQTLTSPEATAEAWEGMFTLERAIPGEHRVVVTVTTPAKRSYQTEVAVNLTGPGAVGALWRANIGGAVQGKITRGPDAVYVPSMGGDLVALDPKNGTERWRVKTGGGIFSTPLYAEGTVYFGSADHFVYAVDAQTGKVKWKRETNGAVFSGPAIAGNVVCAPSTDQAVYGLDAKTGNVVWKAQGEGMFQSQAATDGTRFFVGGWDNQFRCLDAQSGRELWKQPFGRNAKSGAIQFYFAPAIGAPAVQDGKVFITSNDGMMHTLDTQTGNILWEVGRLPFGGIQEPRSLALGYSGPLPVGNRVYNASLTDKGWVFAFDRETGNIIWQTPTGSVVYDSSCAYSPAGGGAVFVGSVDGTFSALRAQNGAVLWQYRLAPGHLLASPAADEERVYIGSLNGEVVAFPVQPPAGITPAPETKASR